MRILNLTMSALHWRVSAARQGTPDALPERARIVEALALYHTYRRKLALIGASEMRSLTGANRRSIDEERSRLQQILDEAIGRAATDELIDPVDAASAGRAISMMCTSLPQWFNPHGPDTPERVAGRYVHFAIAMLGAHRHGS